MTRRKQFAWLAVAALVVLAENVIFFASESKPRRTLSGSDEVDEAFEPSRSGQEFAPLTPIPHSSIDAWFADVGARPRNPFLTVSESGGDQSGLGTELPRLVGTLTSDGRRVVWLGGSARTEGEWLGDLEVRRIETDRVVLGRSGEELQLRLQPRADELAAPLSDAGGEGRDDANE